MIPLRAAPLSISGLEGKQLRAPSLSGDSCAFSRDFLRRRMKQIAHHLPADRRVGIKQPLADFGFHVRTEENLTLTFDKVKICVSGGAGSDSLCKQEKPEARKILVEAVESSPSTARLIGWRSLTVNFAMDSQTSKSFWRYRTLNCNHILDYLIHAHH